MARHLLHDCDEFTLVRFKQLTAKERHESWLKHRREGLGGSDMATILGLNKYKTPDCDEFTLVRFKQLTAKERHESWLKHRREGLGGSDMATILGLNKYKTPYELWLEKTGREQPVDISDKWAIVKGNALEKELRNRFRSLHPEWECYDGTDKSLVSRNHPFLIASLDGVLYDETRGYGVLEIKTTSAHRGKTDWHDMDGNLKIRTIRS